MSWAKLDDQFHAHRKATRAWRGHPRALGLHLLAMSYCAGHLTDGFVDDEFVEEKIPHPRERKQATDALVDAGLWVREDDGWRIHDWLDFNPSRADTIDKRRKEADRKARGRQRQVQECPPGVRADTDEVSARTSAGVRADGSNPSDGPVPARPDPTTPPTPRSGGNGDEPEVLPRRPKSSRTRDRQRFDDDVKAYAAARYPGLPEPHRSQAVASALSTKEPATVESVDAYVQRWVAPLADAGLSDEQRSNIAELGQAASAINRRAERAA